MLKQRFASKVDVNKFAKPVTQPYLPKKNRNPAFVKPNHMIAASSSRNSSKNLPRFSSNDMVHNHYLDVAKKKIQERDRNSTTSGTTSARFQSTTDDSKPKPRSNNQTSKSLHVSKSSRFTITDVPKADHSNSSSSFSYSKQFVCSTCHKCVFNANHDACITKLLKEVNSRAKSPIHKTRNSNKPVDQKSHTQKPGRQIFTGHRFSPNKTSVMYKKTSPRFDLRWKPTGRILKSVGLRWIPTGKLFNSWTSKVDSEPPHGKSQSMAAEKADISETIVKVDSQMMIQKNDLDLLFGPLFDEYFNGENQVVLKSSAVTTTDASNKRQQPDSTSSTSTLATTVTANGNFDLEEEEKKDIYDVATGNDSKETDGPDMEVSVKEARTKNGAENGAENKPIKKAEKEEVVEAPSSRPVEYYLKHRINEKLIEGLVDNNRFNDSLSGARVGKASPGMGRKDKASLRKGDGVQPMDGGDRREIKHLMRLEKEMMGHKEEVTKFLIKNEEEFLTVPEDGVGIKPDGVVSPAM
ncbi:hypothetical protein Tco_0206898 [Tanacetum coccineum]